MVEHFQIESVAFVGRKYEPLYVQNMCGKSDIDIHTFLFMSLDFIEGAVDSFVSKGDEPYLGLVFFMEHTCTYAYCTPSLVKIIVVLQWSGKRPSDECMRKIFKDLYRLYNDVIANPFYTVDSPIASNPALFKRISLACSQHHERL